MYLSVTQKLRLDQLQRLKLETLSLEHRLYWNFLVSQMKGPSGFDFKLLIGSSGSFRKAHCLTMCAKSLQNTGRKFVDSIKSYQALRKNGDQ